LRWTAFLFRLPGSNGPARTALWRALNALDALTLGQGTWAIPHRDGHPPDLERALSHIHAAGGEAWVHEVQNADANDLRLQSRLQASCERLWDGFFNEADRVAFTAHDDPATAAEHLTELRRDYARLLRRDVLISQAARRAERRLDDLVVLIGARALGATPAAPVAADAEPSPAPTIRSASLRRSVSATSVLELADGRVRAILCVEPAVDADWEQAFNEFERFAYAPDPERLPLRHNTITVVSTRADVEEHERAARRRVARFEAYLRR
jgi:hypothetical protein